MLLKKNFAEVEKSLQAPVYINKMNKVKTITVIPLAGDIDQYLTGLAIETLSKTNHFPKNPQIPTLSQVRAFARDKQLGSDAVMYGAVRDLRRVKGQVITGIEKKTREDDIYADIQLYIEDAQTGVVFWSKTVTLHETVKAEWATEIIERQVQRGLEAGERDLIRKIERKEKKDSHIDRIDDHKLKAKEREVIREIESREKEYLRKERARDRQENIDSFPDSVKEDIADNWKKYLGYCGIFILAIIILGAIISLVKFFIHYNNVR
jgi:hypothetical protein